MLIDTLTFTGKERAIALTAFAYMAKDYLARAEGYKPNNPIGKQLLANAEVCRALRFRLLGRDDPRIT